METLMLQVEIHVYRPGFSGRPDTPPKELGLTARSSARSAPRAVQPVKSRDSSGNPTGTSGDQRESADRHGRHPTAVHRRCRK